MNSVWKLKGLVASSGTVAASAPTPTEADILLEGRLGDVGQAAASGLKNARSREPSRSSMSFQLLML